MKGVLGVSRVAAVLATVVVAAAAGGAMVALSDAEETPSQSPAVRARIAAQAAESALGLIKPARGWIRLPSVPRPRAPAGSARAQLENDNLSREERAKLKARATLWVTRSTPRAILAYVRSRLPRDATAHGEFDRWHLARGPPGPIGPNTSDRNPAPRESRILESGIHASASQRRATSAKRWPSRSRGPQTVGS